MDGEPFEPEEEEEQETTYLRWWEELQDAVMSQRDFI
jgi:hypothetical protein